MKALLDFQLIINLEALQPPPYSLSYSFLNFWPDAICLQGQIQLSPSKLKL